MGGLGGEAWKEAELGRLDVGSTENGGQVGAARMGPEMEGMGGLRTHRE